MASQDVCHDESVPQSGTATAALPPTSVARGGGRTELRDLRPELEMLGVLDEYEEFRRKYQQWRLGNGRGARGELAQVERPQRTSEHEPTDGAEFDSPYPEDEEQGQKVFLFRSLSAYWTAISFIVGSVLFAFNSGFSLWRLPSRLMIVWPNFIGGLSFVTGAYASYFQLINIGANDQPVVFVRFSFAPIRAKTALASRVGIVAYLYGAVAFEISPTLEVLQSLDLLEESSISSHSYTIAAINMLGCIGFVTGGLCEVWHLKMFRCCSCVRDNQHELPATCNEAVWWAALLNNIGALFFTVGCIPPFIFLPNRFLVDLTFFLGSVCFTVSSGALVYMWQSHDFGLTLLKQLNFAKFFQSSTQERTETRNVRVFYHEDVLSPHGSESAQKGFSYKGILFVFVTCWLLCVSCVDLIMETELHADEDAPKALERICTTLLILIVLMMQSVTIRLPKVEPFRFAMLATRIILVAWAVVDTWILVDRLKAKVRNVALK